MRTHAIHKQAPLVKRMEPRIRKTQWGFEVWSNISPLAICESFAEAQRKAASIAQTEMMTAPNPERIA